jgi:hypothetical protein
MRCRGNDSHIVAPGGLRARRSLARLTIWLPGCMAGAAGTERRRGIRLVVPWIWLQIDQSGCEIEVIAEQPKTL